MYAPVTGLDYFKMLVAKESQIPLLETAASLAQDEYPNLDLQSVVLEVDQLAKKLAVRTRSASTEMKRLGVMSDFFFKENGFSGNFENYYDPENSFIHRVLETKRGIPISLAIIFVELANTIGLKASGVSFPGHFLINVEFHEGQVLLDPCNGKSFSSADLLAKLAPYRSQLGIPEGEEVPVGVFLQPASARDTVLRMLRNLREIYRKNKDHDRLKHVLNRVLVLDPNNGPDGRYRADLGV